MCVSYAGLPELTIEPSNQNVKSMQPATFSTIVHGVDVHRFTYQWKHDGKDMNGETGGTLKLNNVNREDEGEYRCVVTNQFGDSATYAARLFVTSKNNRLHKISAYQMN